MKAIIPVAGKGTRLRPLTLTTPKVMLEVAGKPIIDHVVDVLLPLEPTEMVFITGYLREIIEKHLHEKYDAETKITTIVQEEQLGTGHAVWMAKKAFDEDVLIYFGDAVVYTDFSIVKDCSCDGIIWVQKVPNPERFGVIVADENDFMVKIVEKPKEFVSDLANIGVYYVKNTKLLEEGIQKSIENHTGETEIYLTEAFQYMIEQGAKIKIVSVDGWWDCGTVQDLEDTDRILRAKQS